MSVKPSDRRILAIATRETADNLPFESDSRDVFGEVLAFARTAYIDGCPVTPSGEIDPILGEDDRSGVGR